MKKHYLILTLLILIIINIGLSAQVKQEEKIKTTGVTLSCTAGVELIRIEFYKTPVDSISFVSSKTNYEPDPIIEVIKATDDKKDIIFTTILHNL